MSYVRFIAGMLSVSLCFASGCASGQAGKNAWKEVRGAYGSHVNSPAAFDPDNRAYGEPYEIDLIESMAEVDFQMDQLRRAMDDSDRSPDGEWAEAMFRKFPWLSGIALADGQGRVFAREPENDDSDLFLEPLLINRPRQNQTELRARVRNSGQGAEFLLAKPVYMQSELRALIVARFNLHDLLRVAGKPERFALAAGGELLWPGSCVIEETPLRDADWEQLGAARVDGKLSNARGEFYWLSTYLADLRLFYSLPVSGNFSSDSRRPDLLKR